MIGKYVVKKSGKPFKSGKKMGQIKEIVQHPITGRSAFKLDDQSIVEQRICIVQ